MASSNTRAHYPADKNARSGRSRTDDAVHEYGGKVSGLTGGRGGIDNNGEYVVVVSVASFDVCIYIFLRIYVVCA